MNELKVIGMSDMHGKLPAPEDLPKSDLVAIAGDISPLNIQRNAPAMMEWIMNDFASWIKRLDTSKVFLVVGNHDFVFYNKATGEDAIWLINDVTDGKCVYLADQDYTFKGKVIYGSPWVNGPAGWAFFDPSMKRIKETMSENVDLAIFHSPIMQWDNGTSLELLDRPQWGSKNLEDIIYNKSPKNVITGHVHSGNHEWHEIVTANGHANLCNVSLLNEDYKMAYEPTLFTI